MFIPDRLVHSTLALPASRERFVGPPLSIGAVWPKARARFSGSSLGVFRGVMKGTYLINQWLTWKRGVRLFGLEQAQKK